ncbi:MAG: hypothetical protein ACK4F9_05420 [Brevinematia bacterium]
MHFIYPSEKRKFIIGEFIKLDSPTIIITTKTISDSFTSSPLKIISHKNLHYLNTNTDKYNCIILDPEFFYPISPLFNKKYLKIYEFIKNANFKNINVFSCSLPYNTLKTFLKEIGYQNKNIKVIFELSKNINVYFCNNKIETLLSKLDIDDRELIICKNAEEANTLKEYLNRHNKHTKNVLILDRNDFDIRKTIIGRLKANKGILIIPRNLKNLIRNINFSSVSYLSIPNSIQKFIHDIVSLSSYRYNLFVSSKDEIIFLKRIKKKPNLKEEYISTLNFLGFRGDKTRYLERYLSSHKQQYNLTKTGLSMLDKKEKIIFSSLVNRYFRYEDCVDLLMGINNKILYRCFGIMRGHTRDYISQTINNLVNNGKLGFKYFLSNGNIVKKVY